MYEEITTMRNPKIVRMVQLALLCALSILLMFVVRFPIFPAAPFLEYDMGDVPILIGTFMFGPVSGLLITVVVSVLQWLIVSPQSGWVGAVMHIFATGAFVLIAGTIYKKNKSLKGAVIALICGSIAMIIAMVPMNYLISPFYLLSDQLPYRAAQQMYMDNYYWYSTGFNAIKSILNTVLTFVLYKGMVRVLRLIDKSNSQLC